MVVPVIPVPTGAMTLSFLSQTVGIALRLSFISLWSHVACAHSGNVGFHVLADMESLVLEVSTAVTSLPMVQLDATAMHRELDELLQVSAGFSCVMNHMPFSCGRIIVLFGLIFSFDFCISQFQNLSDSGETWMNSFGAVKEECDISFQGTVRISKLRE